MKNGRHICPTCHKAVAWGGNSFRPFCSERCRLVDLQGWLGERYRIPQEESPDFENHTERNGHRDSEIENS